MANLISVCLEATKIKEESEIDAFIKNINTDFCKLQKIYKKSGYGCLLKTKFATVEEIKNSDELKFILNKMIDIGFKAHDAKNNYLTITCSSNGISKTIQKKVDLLVLNMKPFCQRFARKDKVFSFNFEEKYFYDLARNVHKSPIKWSENEISFVFFRSTLKFETIMASIEYVESLFQFIDSQNISYESLFEHCSLVARNYINYANTHFLYFANYYKEKFS